MSLQQYEYDFTSLAQPVGLGDNFWLDGRPLAIAFCHAIPERMADLLEVAMTVYASDRRSLRDYRGANTGHRRIRIRLGVRDPRFWSRREMHDRLTDYLCWLSDDEWSFDFVRRDAPATAAESDRFLFHTKAEMCRTLAEAGLAEGVRETVSCDSYPMRVPEKAHCGRCTSCTLRRQALHCSGLVSHDPPKDYQYNVLSNGTSLDLDTVFGLEVMRSQVQKLRRHLSADAPWRELVSSYPELARAAAQIAGQDDLNIGQVSSDFVRLYRTYVYEWDSFPVTSSRAA